MIPATLANLPHPTARSSLPVGALQCRRARVQPLRRDCRPGPGRLRRVCREHRMLSPDARRGHASGKARRPRLGHDQSERRSRLHLRHRQRRRDAETVERATPGDDIAAFCSARVYTPIPQTDPVAYAARGGNDLRCGTVAIRPSLQQTKAGSHSSPRRRIASARSPSGPRSSRSCGSTEPSRTR